MIAEFLLRHCCFAWLLREKAKNLWNTIEEIGVYLTIISAARLGCSEASLRSPRTFSSNAWKIRFSSSSLARSFFSSRGSACGLQLGYRHSGVEHIHLWKMQIHSYSILAEFIFSLFQDKMLILSNYYALKSNYPKKDHGCRIFLELLLHLLEMGQFLLQLLPTASHLRTCGKLPHRVVGST